MALYKYAYYYYYYYYTQLYTTQLTQTAKATLDPLPLKTLSIETWWAYSTAYETTWGARKHNLSFSPHYKVTPQSKVTTHQVLILLQAKLKFSTRHHFCHLSDGAEVCKNITKYLQLRSILLKHENAASLYHMSQILGEKYN